jgi:phosphoribosylformylglycinamidine synthase
LNFICKDVYLKTENYSTKFTNQIPDGKILRIPIAHGEGNYFADDETIKKLNDNNQIIFRYCTPEGEITARANPNGAMQNIAGIINENGNVLGMMPHPERLSDKQLGGDDGLFIFKSIINTLK